MIGVVTGMVEKGLIPDALTRAGIRKLLRARIRELDTANCEAVSLRAESFFQMMNNSPIAPVPEMANEQHYEVPAAFFEKVLGPAAKYSCCYWEEVNDDLDRAEQLALAVTCERAQLADNQQILELGCGWGSLTLYMASQYPNSHITAVSNSASQHDFIMARAQQANVKNITVITADMNDFETNNQFDRVVSIEMFEHMRNYEVLYRRVYDWLKPGGLLFKHIFVHKNSPYEFIDRGPADWMSRHFFSGGIMPSDELPLHFQKDLTLVNRWRWNGQHYEKTLNSWLHRMDLLKAELMPVINSTYGERDGVIWWHRWRLFFMASAELFGFSQGNEWWVTHYLFEKRGLGTRGTE